MKVLPIVFLFFIPCLAFAQNETEQKSSLHNYLVSSDYRMALTTTGIGMPPNFINGGLHPGLQVGFQRALKAGSKLDYSFDLEYFAIPSLQRVAAFRPSLGFPIQLAKWIELRPNVNLALMLTHQLNDEFRFTSTGQYEAVGKNRLQVSPSIGLETFIQLAQKQKMNYELMLGYAFGMQLPFSALSSLLPLNQLKVGVRLKRNK